MNPQPHFTRHGAVISAIIDGERRGSVGFCRGEGESGRGL